MIFISKQWIVLKARSSDWLLKLRISLAIHLRANCAEFSHRCRNKWVKISFFLYDLTKYILKKTIHFSVSG